ncbi:MAG: molecular chaperone DnaJ [Parasphingopyxis sp.]|uniref:molecular chaperone DnaJ n=1 Tax=Parasphingopyxis sp. TaxID=1920299 RepID=UPI003F9F0196
MTEVDYYELLRVDRGVDGATLKSAYRKLAMEYHPDRNPGDAECEAKFKSINEAYECLKDPQKRAAYDRFGHAAFQNGGGGHQQDGFSAFSDIFENIFGEDFMGAGRGRGRGRDVRRGADLRYDYEITLEEAFNGKDAQLTLDVTASCETCEGSGAKPGTSAQTCATCQGHGKVRAQQGLFLVERTCPSCHGLGQVIADPCEDCRGEGRVDTTKTIDVKIPPGVDDGTRIRVSGEGEAGARGGPAGDLYIFIHLQRHELFQREGTTLFARCPISFTTAALGGSIEVPGLDGEVHEFQIPPGMQTGKQLRKRGAGMPVLQGRGHGDLVAQFDVETPTKLSAKQKELLQEFRETETGEESPQSAGFFDKLKTMFGE